MKAKVTQEFPGRPDGEALARTITVNEVITGDLAAYAVANKLAEELFVDADEVEEKPAKKVRK